MLALEGTGDALASCPNGVMVASSTTGSSQMAYDRSSIGSRTTRRSGSGDSTDFKHCSRRWMNERQVGKLTEVLAHQAG